MCMCVFMCSLASVEPFREWVLEAFEDTDNGKLLLLDPESNTVYLPPDKVKAVLGV